MIYARAAAFFLESPSSLAATRAPFFGANNGESSCIYSRDGG